MDARGPAPPPGVLLGELNFTLPCLCSGLYLYILVAETFTRENVRLRCYVLIGWGECTSSASCSPAPMCLEF